MESGQPTTFDDALAPESLAPDCGVAVDDARQHLAKVLLLWWHRHLHHPDTDVRAAAAEGKHPGVTRKGLAREEEVDLVRPVADVLVVPADGDDPISSRRFSASDDPSREGVAPVCSDHESRPQAPGSPAVELEPEVRAARLETPDVGTLDDSRAGSRGGLHETNVELHAWNDAPQVRDIRADRESSRDQRLAVEVDGRRIDARRPGDAVGSCQSECGQLEESGMADEVATDLVAGEGTSIDEQHVDTRPRKMHRRRRARRACAEDDHLGVDWLTDDQLEHRASDPSRSRCTGRRRFAPTNVPRAAPASNTS